MALGPLTGLFGTNSSGKTSLIQFLLLLKQTAESNDRARVLHLGDDKTYVDLGTLHDVLHNHADPGELEFALGWKLPEPQTFRNAATEEEQVVDRLAFEASIRRYHQQISVSHFHYRVGEWALGMTRNPSKSKSPAYGKYELLTTGFAAFRSADSSRSRWDLPAPVKCYGFPDETFAYYQNVGFLRDLALQFEKAFGRCYYLGPLREYPKRNYQWGGDRPEGVGAKGELAVAALLAARAGESGPKKATPGHPPALTLETQVARWLQQLGLIHSFSVQPIARNRKDYEVRVKRTADSADVLITDVGFGVSQILPVLVLCYYVPEGSTIILEQPEIHLHPAVQGGLADVFIDAIKSRGVQIILESHSEHLLKRLQTRLAQEVLTPEQVKLYFADFQQGESVLTPLQLDDFGNIRNWPDGFFGDPFAEAADHLEAEMKRRQRPQL